MESLIRFEFTDVQGAYTGVCSAQHVPSYKKNVDKFKAKGIDSLICVAVNDPYTLNAWAEKLEAKDAVSNFFYFSPFIIKLYFFRYEPWEKLQAKDVVSNFFHLFPFFYQITFFFWVWVMSETWS